MKVGDMVRRKPEWGEWVKYNPWMHTQKDFEVGLLVLVDIDLVKVLWPSVGISWEEKKDLIEFIKGVQQWR